MPEVNEFIKGFIYAIVGVIVAVYLLPVYMTSVAAANITDPIQASLVGLVGIFITLGIVMFAVRTFIA